MREFHSLMYLLPRLLRALLTRPRTVRYPFTSLALPPHFRGRLEADAQRCRGCGLCVRDCPAFALELDKRSGDEFALLYHPDRCAYCGQCAMSCPVGAIRQVNEYVSPSPDRASLAQVLAQKKPDTH